jgi:hypothetical protein
MLECMEVSVSLYENIIHIYLKTNVEFDQRLNVMEANCDKTLSLVQRIKNELKEITKVAEEDGNYDTAHEQADELLCKLLISLGYEEVVNEWQKVPKWYY